MKLPEVPVFRPTLSEFEDFPSYIAKLDKKVTTGICKVIPPKKWLAALHYEEDYSELDSMLIESPIKQVVAGLSGVYKMFPVEQKGMGVGVFRALAEEHDGKHLPMNKRGDHASVEDHYWRHIRYHSPIYGADTPGTLMEGMSCWNIGELPSILDGLNGSVPGVTDPYLYFGMFGATFAWHTEDMDLYSINYLHVGAPKSWYCIAPDNAERFETITDGLFPGDRAECPNFMRHKMFHISPKVLRDAGMPMAHTVQEEGEFVITFPRGYHAGFNHGFNCAESTNFAMERWLDVGKFATVCGCRADSVTINVHKLESTLVKQNRVSMARVTEWMDERPGEGPMRRTGRCGKSKRFHDDVENRPRKKPRPNGHPKEKKMKKKKKKKKKKKEKSEEHDYDDDEDEEEVAYTSVSVDDIDRKEVFKEGAKCAFCRSADVRACGGFVPYAFVVGKSRLIWTHEHCAKFTPDVGFTTDVSGAVTHWSNVREAVRRASRLKCWSCREPGASIGCWAHCRRSFHFACTGVPLDVWENNLPRAFYCSKHSSTGAPGVCPLPTAHSDDEGASPEPRPSTTATTAAATTTTTTTAAATTTTATATTTTTTTTTAILARTPMPFAGSSHLHSTPSTTPRSSTTPASSSATAPSSTTPASSSATAAHSPAPPAAFLVPAARSAYSRAILDPTEGIGADDGTLDAAAAPLPLFRGLSVLEKEERDTFGSSTPLSTSATFLPPASSLLGLPLERPLEDEGVLGVARGIPSSRGWYEVVK